jgi:hypothetical protein
VITRAVVAAEAGETVTVLIDDGPGARIATTEVDRAFDLTDQCLTDQWWCEEAP